VPNDPELHFGLAVSGVTKDVLDMHLLPYGAEKAEGNGAAPRVMTVQQTHKNSGKKTIL